MLVLCCKTLGGNAEGPRLTLLDGGWGQSLWALFSPTGLQSVTFSFPGVRKFRSAPPRPLYCSGNSQVAPWAQNCVPALICKDNPPLAGGARLPQEPRGSRRKTTEKETDIDVSLFSRNLKNKIKELNESNPAGFRGSPAQPEISSPSVGLVMEGLEVQLRAPLGFP